MAVGKIRQASISLSLPSFSLRQFTASNSLGPALASNCQKAKVLTNRQWATGLDRSIAYLVASLANMVRLDEQKCLLVTI